jgi:hypothetical protein
MYQVSVATLTKLASAYVANVLAPVEPEPACISVTPPAGEIVVDPLAMIKIAVPTAKFSVPLLGIVIVPEP